MNKKLKIGKKSGLRYFNVEDIRSWKPCYDPSRHLPEDFRGTAIDILKNDKIPTHDRIWVVTRTQLLSERVMRLFAVWCARQTKNHVLANPAIAAALAAAEDYANGHINAKALSAARSAADSAAYSAADSAAYSAADSAARSAAYSAAYSAADSAARSAAYSAARSAQVNKLIEMVTEEGKQRVESKNKKASAK